MKKVSYLNSPIGVLAIVEEKSAITGLFFGKKKIPGCEPTAPASGAEAETPLIKKTKTQLEEYFAGKRRSFDLPLCLIGTEFQCSVWEALKNIPYGQTRAYSDIAADVGNPRACRAVGMANNRNPISIIIPCHRVIGKDKSLTGYGGGLEAKRFLLELEEETLKTARK